MMKKILTVLLFVAGTLASKGYDYPYLVFQGADGNTTAVSVTSLVITVSDGKLVITNADGSQTLTLSSLNSMSFSQESDLTGIVYTRLKSAEETDGEQWYTLGGVRLSGKPSTKGVYVLKSRNRTTKITIK